MVVFIMMAVGLNIVVGYAGLLDLGYVAFYAIGAYIAGLVRLRAVRRAKCRNPHFGDRELPGRSSSRSSNLVFGGVGVPPGTGGIHLSIFLVVLIAGVITAGSSGS